MSNSLPSAVGMERMCDPCPEAQPADPDPPTCGNSTLLGEFFSAYILEESQLASLSYKYWQCVGDPLHNPPDQVLDSTLILRFEATESPGECIDICEENGFPIAMINGRTAAAATEQTAAGVSCTCLVLYKFLSLIHI